MDADDISLPERLEQQVAFMEANPAVGACGTWVATVGDGDPSVWRYPEGAEAIRCRLLFKSAFAHPSVCMRREIFARHGLQFDGAHPHAEDYELWSRACELSPLANLGSVLLRYRVHAASVSQQHRDAQEATTKKIHRKLLSRLGLVPTDEELFVHRWAAAGGPACGALPLRATELWLEKLLRSNEVHEIHPKRAFKQLLGQYWFASAHRNLGAGRPAVTRFINSPLARCVDLGNRVRLVGHAAKRFVRSGSRRVGPQR